jgi:HEAT repeat protein
MRALSRHFWIGLLAIACTMSQLIGQDAGDLLSQIRKQNDQVDPAVFDQLGQMHSKQSLQALQKGIKLLQFEASYARAYFALRLFCGTDLEQEAIDYLLESSVQGKVEQRPWALRALLEFVAVAPSDQAEESVHLALRKFLQLSPDVELRAKALGPLLDDFSYPASSENLELFLANFQAGISGSRMEALEFLDKYPWELKRVAFDTVLGQKKFPSARKDFILENLNQDLSAAGDRLLVGSLSDQDPEVALQALRGLEARNYAHHEKSLRKLCKSKLEMLRFEAFQALARLRNDDPAWISELQRLGRSKDSVQRLTAVYQSGRLPRQEVMNVLRLHLQDANLTIRSAALLMLEQLRQRDAVPILIDRLDQETAVMQYRVQAVLASLTGQDFGNQAEPWRRWWQDHGEDFALPTAEEVYQLGMLRAAKWGAGRSSGFYGVPVISSRVIFVLDTSGSMSEDFEIGLGHTTEKGTRLSIAKKQLIRALDRIGKGEKFNMIFFDSHARAWMNELTKMSDAAKKYAVDFVKAQKPDGVTAMYDALKIAYRDPEVDTIYLVTDGYPEGGEIQDPDKIRQRVRAWNKLRLINIHCISVGGDIDLLRGLAADSGGTYTVIY